LCFYNTKEHHLQLTGNAEDRVLVSLRIASLLNLLPRKSITTRPPLSFSPSLKLKNKPIVIDCNPKDKPILIDCNPQPLQTKVTQDGLAHESPAEPGGEGEEVTALTAEGATGNVSQQQYSLETCKHAHSSAASHNLQPNILPVALALSPVYSYPNFGSANTDTAISKFFDSCPTKTNKKQRKLIILHAKNLAKRKHDTNTIAHHVLQTSNTNIVATLKKSNHSIAGVDAKMSQVLKHMQELSKTQKGLGKQMKEQFSLLLTAVAASKTISGESESIIRKLIAVHEQGKQAALDKVCKLARAYLEAQSKAGAATFKEAAAESCEKLETALTAVAEDINEAVQGIPGSDSTPFSTSRKRKGASHSSADKKRPAKAQAEAHMSKPELDDLARRLRRALKDNGIPERDAEAIANKVAEIIGRTGEMGYDGFAHALTNKLNIKTAATRAKVVTVTAGVLGTGRFKY
jgi:hypothetical protein